MSEYRKSLLSKTDRQFMSSQDLYKTDLEEHLSDMGQAILFTNLKQKLLEASEVMNTRKALKQQRQYNKLSFLRQICFFGLIGISFFETPLWCQSGKYIDNCQYPVDDQSDLIPVSGLPYIPKTIFYIVQIILLLFLAVNKAMKYRFMHRTNKRITILILMFLIVFLALVDNIVQYLIDPYNINATLVLCPLFFVLYHGRLRRTVILFFHVMKKGFPLLGAIFFNVFLFAGLGGVIFQNMKEDNIFMKFWDACYELLVLQTTSNFPDIMMPFYIRYKWAPIFFIIFLIINYFLLTNMLLGVFYMYYKSQIQESTKKYFLQQEKIMGQIQKLKEHELKLQLLKKKSEIQSTGGDRSFDRSQSTLRNSSSKDSGSIKYKTVEVQEMLQGSNIEAEQDMDIVFQRKNIFIDENKESQIQDAQKQYEQNLEKMERRLRLQSKVSQKYEEYIEKENFKRRNSANSSALTADDVLTVATKQFGLAKQPNQDFMKLNIENNKLKKAIRNLLKNVYFEIFMGILSLLSFLIIIMNENYDSDVPIGEIIYINFVINILFLIETFARLYVLGRQFFRRKLFIYEGVISLCLFAFFLVFLTKGKLEYFIDIFIIFKLFRFLLVLSRINGVEKIFSSLASFLPFFVDMLSVLFIFFYIFSGIGQHIFGGEYRFSKQHLISPTQYDNYDVPDYIYNNFNDLTNGFVLLFELLVVNNWCVNTEVGCAIMGSKWYRLYFIVWFILAVILFFNILVAFIIDHLVNEWELQDHQELEALEKKNKASFLQDEIEEDLESENSDTHHSDTTPQDSPQRQQKPPSHKISKETLDEDDKNEAVILQKKLKKVSTLIIDKMQQAQRKETSVRAEYDKQEKYTQMLQQQYKAQLALEKKINKQQKILQKKLELQEKKMQQGQVRLHQSQSLSIRNTDASNLILRRENNSLVIKSNYMENIDEQEQEEQKTNTANQKIKQKSQSEEKLTYPQFYDEQLQDQQTSSIQQHISQQEVNEFDHQSINSCDKNSFSSSTKVVDNQSIKNQ